MKESEFLFLILLTILFMAGLWMVDVSVGAMNGCRLEGMFFKVNPYFTYHLGLLISTLSYIIGIGYIKFKEIK